MRTIHKYRLSPVVEMPTGATILKVEQVGAHAFIWAEVDTDCFMEQRYFTVFGTGWDIDTEDKLKHIGTYIQRGSAEDAYVWHVYERKYE